MLAHKTTEDRAQPMLLNLKIYTVSLWRTLELVIRDAGFSHYSGQYRYALTSNGVASQ